MTDRVKVRITRPLVYRGECVPAGVILTLDAAEAQNALDSGRCALLDPADRAHALAGRRAEVNALMRREQRVAPMADGPWRPMY